MVSKRKRSKHKEVVPAYNVSDSSDEEGKATRVGNVPLEWYKRFNHIGYDQNGKKVKPKVVPLPLEEIIKLAKNNKYVIYDEYNDKEITLEKSELKLIKKIRQHRYASATFDPYPDYNFGNGKVVDFPIRTKSAKKRKPNLYEKKEILRLVNAIKNGWVRTKQKKEKSEQKKQLEMLIWEEKAKTPQDILDTFLPSNSLRKRFRPYEPALKAEKPTTRESFNPPKQFLMDENELEMWEAMDPKERENNFIPRKIRAMRLIPNYQNSLRERFERCLKIFSAPRIVAKKLRQKKIEPTGENAIVPNAEEFRPFPSRLGLKFKGHRGKIVALSVSHCGRWLLTASEDKSAKVWETANGRCIKSIHIESNETFKKAEFAPSHFQNAFLLVIDRSSEETTSSKIELIALPELATSSKPSGLAAEIFGGESTQKKNRFTAQSSKLQKMLKSIKLRMKKKPSQNRIKITSKSKILGVAWHPHEHSLAVIIASKPFVVLCDLRDSSARAPLPKLKTPPLSIAFAPRRDFFFAAFTDSVRVYGTETPSFSLAKLLKCANTKITSLAISPSNEQLLVGCEDRSVRLFDFEVASRPICQRFHSRLVLSAAFHPQRPLFASASAAGRVFVAHLRVFEDLSRDPQISPLRLLSVAQPPRAAAPRCAFHPSQPWLFCSGPSDHSVWLFTD